MLVSAPRILIAATASGVGKTTLTCGLLRAVQRRGLRVQACKCGPDYLDPAFHRAVLGVPSRNLDVFLAGESVVRELVAEGSRDADVTLIEGAMGYYDGIAQSSDASAYDVARITQTPTVLAVDARGRALSIAAEVRGFMRFREPSQVAGVILNHAKPSYFAQLKAMIERECNVPVLGYAPTLEAAAFEHRHLGLIAAEEVDDLQNKIDALADAVEKTIDVEALLAIARAADPLDHTPRSLPEPCAGRPLVAVARDEAFNFYYDDSLALLERLGAKLAYFSPMRDKELPAGACGLYLGGGYPELHTRELSENVGMRNQIRDAIGSGMPTIAECGGFLYLHEELEDARGTAWPMVGALPARAWRAERMSRFGYVTLTAHADGLLADAGQSMPAHEFHYWESGDQGRAFHAQKPQSPRGWDCGVHTRTLYAGFPHVYLNGQPDMTKRFVDACAAFARSCGVQ